MKSDCKPESKQMTETQEAIELAKAYVNEGDDDATAIWKACEVFRKANKPLVEKAIGDWT